MTTYRAAVYLQIPAEYCRWFGGLRWAHYGEAVEFLEGPSAGCTFAFAREIALFLEGLRAADGPLLDFGLVLHLLYLIGLGDRATSLGPGRCLERIAGAFRTLGCPLRNAGALCAWLCRGVPAALDGPALAEIQELLVGGNWIPQMVLSHPFLGTNDRANPPRLDPTEFEHQIERVLESLSDGDIRHWLRHGRRPEQNEDDRLIPPRPPGLTRILAGVEQRPRLAGIARLVSRLEGALSLPPRRRASALLQCGGYSDVTTRGSPEQILPIQFALDDEEFLRRFAEQELLYLHREEPHQPTTEQLVLLLDQGVRTWGDVRLVLSGAALALARQAHRKDVEIRLAATSNRGEPLDPAGTDSSALFALLEASDLSPHPAEALAALLRSGVSANRDVVLLTHPRSLAEPAVAAAARLIDSETGSRLFAVSLDQARQVELAELRNGLPVLLGRCRIDWPVDALTGPSPGRPARTTPWNGDVEPIGFPFRCGLLERIESRVAPGSAPLDFDDSGARVLIVGRHGLLSVWRIDGTDVEILPRPLLSGLSVLPVQTVIGVAGGFVLVGHPQGQPVLAHYDFTARNCALHTLEAVKGVISWFYYRDLHAIAGRLSKGSGRTPAVDLLATGAGAFSSSRAIAAAKRADGEISPDALTSSQLASSPRDPHDQRGLLALHLDSHRGALDYRLGPAGVKSLIPLSNGRPALKGGWIVQDRQGGDVLAVQIDGAAAPGLYFISLSRGAVLGTFPLRDPSVANVFALSHDGRQFAHLSGSYQLEVRDVPGDRPPALATSQEDGWVHFATLGRSCLLVREFEWTGPRSVRSSCLIRWDQTRLEVVYHDAHELLEKLGGCIAESRSLSPGDEAQTPGSVPGRFVQVVEYHPLRILIDRYNHIAVLREGKELICMFYVNRGEVAAWMPDGTCWGSRRLIGGESAPGAAVRIAAALRSAEQPERVSPW
jgi:hypothetical protein